MKTTVKKLTYEQLAARWIEDYGTGCIAVLRCEAVNPEYMNVKRSITFRLIDALRNNHMAASSKNMVALVEAI